MLDILMQLIAIISCRMCDLMGLLEFFCEVLDFWSQVFLFLKFMR